MTFDFGIGCGPLQVCNYNADDCGDTREIANKIQHVDNKRQAAIINDRILTLVRSFYGHYGAGNSALPHAMNLRHLRRVK